MKLKSTWVATHPQKIMSLLPYFNQLATSSNTAQMFTLKFDLHYTLIEITITFLSTYCMVFLFVLLVSLLDLIFFQITVIAQ